MIIYFAGTAVYAQENTVSPVQEQTDETRLVLDDTRADTPASIGTLSSFSVWDFLRMVFVLAIVVVIIYGVFYFIRKAGRPRDDGLKFIHVLETRPLGASRHLHLVEVGSEVFLVGSAESGVHLVSRLNDKETLDGIRLEASQTRPRNISFTDALKSFFRKGKSGPRPEPAALEGVNPGSDVSSLDYLRQQEIRLKKLL